MRELGGEATHLNGPEPKRVTADLRPKQPRKTESGEPILLPRTSKLAPFSQRHQESRGLDERWRTKNGSKNWLWTGRARLSRLQRDKRKQQRKKARAEKRGSRKKSNITGASGGPNKLERKDLKNVEK